MVVLREGDYVWVDTSIGVPIGAEVQFADSGQLVLIDDEGKEHKINNKDASFKPMHPTSVKGVDDMIQLGDLNEAGLLRNLYIRHKEGIIYTYTGSILVAVNPYQLLPIYTLDQVEMYTDRRLGELPPHVFAIADSCFFNMRRSHKNQCCIISGESGAGKTESTKLMLQFLAAVSGQHSWIEQQVLEANSILEAFGNAKTVRNDNSSRFGKYIDIHFTKGGVIEGARVDQYLLEKSRVCRQGPDERNYHIFYCMLLGMSSEEKNLLSLGTPAQYNYLISEQGNCTSCEGRDDIMEYAHIRSAMKILAFTDNDSWEINKLLASILHMGNVTFDAIVSNNLEGCHVESSTHFNMAAKLLEVDSMALADSLTHRSFMTTRESVTKSLSAEQAMDGRDAFAKAIYGKLFVWIVEKINSAVYKPPSDDSNYFGRSIGLLDIFGFENFKQNSFEQLCINFANEQLQQFFVKHVFKLEQEEYARENIVWKHIDFNDNQKTLDVLANKSVNILALIDEESHFPKGTDITMLNKMNQVHGQSNVYIPPKNNHETQFGIHHFAGVVYYDSIGFLEKNRDALSSDLINLVETSSNKLLKLIFQNELSSNEVVKVSNPKLIITRRNSLMQTGDLTKKRVPTLSGQFRQSLEALMKTLTACQPYFIRCIKPNDYKKPLLFDRELCMRQLRYSGMMETIRIRKAGYPIRHSFDEFLARYRTLLNSAVCNPKVESPRRCSESICMNILTSAEDWKVGKTKVFLKDYHDTMLELARDRALNKKVLIIQRVLKGYKYRRDFLKKRSAAVVLQKHWRAYKGKKLYRVVQLGFARLQAKVRARQLCHQYQQRREATVVLQTHVRGHLARKEWNRKRQAVILLQAHTRGMLARRAMNKRKKDALLTAQERRAEEAALRERQRKLDEVLRQKKEREEAAKAQAMTDQEMVNEIFEFLPQEVEGQDQGQAPQAFKDLEEKRMVLEEVDLDETPIMEAPQEEEFDDLDEYSFNKFASMYFQGAATPTHLRQRLQEPLLFHEDENDTLASLNVWWIILRFMGDLPEPRPQQGTEQRVREHDNSMIGENATLDRPLSTLEKVHIIVRYAIVRPNLRDEILCQICKQLQENRNKNSYFRGWVLLSICLGIFPPSTRFIKYLQSFLRFGPVGYAPYCTERLRRTVANGVRGEPPSWLELQASQTKKPISVSVTLMDGRTVSLPVDSASNSKEVCQVLSQRFNIKDTFGFSLYAAIYDKVWSLGSGREHVMDAISQSEQEVRRKGGQEQHAPWRLYFRKEIFTPWHDCSFDNVSTDLIYKQVIRGLKYGEYRCDKEDDYVQLAVKHYYVLHGSNASAANAKNVVQECINTKLVESKTEARWVQLVSSSHAQCPYITSKTKPEKVKAETVDYARKKWPMLFSRFYEVAKVSGPALPKNMFILAINWTGITFLDERERKFLEVSYPEITGVSTVRDPKSFGQSVSLHTLKGDFILSAVMATDITDLITTFLAGLKERSHYAVALQESNRPDDPTILSFKKGELILLIKDDDYSAERGWVKGQSERTGKTGAVPLEAILILPTITKPTNEVMSLINLSPDQRKNIINSTIRGTVAERLAPASLKEYSIEYFRQPTVDVNRQVIAKNSAPERLWMSSKEPIRQPLLKRLVGNAEFTQQACRAFTAILKYMGDYPTRQVQNPMELTDQIFGPPTKNEAMRDEIYCQIMKQMTNNQGRYSMDQGWQLLWLCCGLFPPSNSLLKHAQRFIESRRLDPLASDCLQRLQGALRVEPRKLPPHQLEVNAIQQDSTQILHKIFFPNDDGEIFEIGTNTRVRDLIRTIASKLKLVSDEGFSLFVKTPNKVLSMNDADYFFDSLRHITDWMKQIKGVKEGEPVSMPYTVFFMRKLWFNMNPGKDLVADLVFHYPQEMPKYLRGYHHCSKEEMVQLAALLFRVKVNNDKTQFVTIPKMLKELVPSDQLKAMSTDEWKKSIVASYNKQGDMTVQDAMVAFLKVVSKWPTFGCAFFEVKQTSEPTFPDIVRIAINRLGVTIIRPKDKVVLATHPYNTIANWCSGSTYFHMTIGSLVKGTKLLCETSLGYKMDDLLTSYVNMYKKKAVGHRIRRYD